MAINKEIKMYSRKMLMNFTHKSIFSTEDFLARRYNKYSGGM